MLEFSKLLSECALYFPTYFVLFCPLFLISCHIWVTGLQLEIFIILNKYNLKLHICLCRISLDLVWYKYHIALWLADWCGLHSFLSSSCSEFVFTNFPHLCHLRLIPKHQWHNLNLHLLIIGVHVCLTILKEKSLVPHPRSWILKWRRAPKSLF